MKVRMIRERSIQGAGPLGPMTRVFDIGEVVDLPDMHATMFLAGGDAEPVGDEDEKPKPRRSAKA